MGSVGVGSVGEGAGVVREDCWNLGEGVLEERRFLHKYVIIKME